MFEIRPAKFKDCRLIWEWRNDPITRRYSFNTEVIPFKKHKIWFKNALKDKNRKILLIEVDKTPAGVVRFDIDPKNQNTEINVNIDPEKRGKGLGTRAIKASCRYAFSHLNIVKVMAKIKKENVSSIRAFSKAGFCVTQEDDVIVMKLKK